MQGLGLDVGQSMQQSQDKDLSNNSHSSNPNNSNIGKSEPTKENVPKKMTWASIASQPAKPQVLFSFSINLFYSSIYIHILSM